MTSKPEAFERFEKLARAIVRVPKREIENAQPKKTSTKTAKRSKTRRVSR